ncbi:STM4014 family protein [Dactylosporangium sp. NPDC049742]|uniref:STM4014 family protein n=1 Tax=Dactylosporangium sp. NPDC049742 TaxID=3154737 RepID=UPI003421CFB1
MTAITVVGVPGNRRVGLFRDAAVAAGLPEPTVVSWRDVCAGARVDGGGSSWIRLESPGEDAETDRLLRGAASEAAHGEIVGLAAWHRGLVAAARQVEAWGVPLLTAVDELDVMFDKRRCHALLRSRGVAVPEAFAAVGYQEIRERGWRRVFVKPPHGSSASGVVALGFGGARERGRVVAYTSAALDGGKLYNQLRVHRYTDERTIAAIVDRLAVDGLHVERWLPKASHDGLVFDLRVLVVAGRVSHVVVRTGRSPMTNLHLGNARGDLPGVRAAVGEEHWAAAMRTCEAAAACFPGSLHVGVDLMFGRDHGTHAVAEVNAFGDLLPGLLVAGRDTYAAELDALLSGRFTAPLPSPAAGVQAQAVADQPPQSVAREPSLLAALPQAVVGTVRAPIRIGEPAVVTAPPGMFARGTVAARPPHVAVAGQGALDGAVVGPGVPRVVVAGSGVPRVVVVGPGVPRVVVAGSGVSRVAVGGQGAPGGGSAAGAAARGGVAESWAVR